jgi:hypothetical protein
MVEESNAKKAMRAMLSGKIDESVINFNKLNKQIDNKLGDVPVKTTNKQRNTFKESNETFDDYEAENEMDFASEYKRKLNEARANGTEEVFINGHTKTNEPTNVSSDAISKLLGGKLNEAKEILKPKQIITETIKNPIDFYCKPQSEKKLYTEEIDNNLIIQEVLNSPKLKTLLLELLLDDVVNSGRLKKMVNGILKDELKPALLTVLKEIKGNK